MVLIERHLTALEQRGLFIRSDAYLSLHRSEGLGLTVAEAIAVGTPVIATNYGGNAEFCSEATWLVGYDLIDIPVTTPVYAGCGRWAEPDIGHAASCLRSIATDPVTASSRAAAAQTALAERNTATERDGSLVFRELVRPTPAPLTFGATDA